MFVMMEPRDACCLAGRRLEKTKTEKRQTLTAQQKTACEQVIELAKKLPPHAALVLTPAEFEAFYMPPEPMVQGGEILTPEQLEERIAKPRDPNEQPDPAQGGSAPYTAAPLPRVPFDVPGPPADETPAKKSWRDNPQGQLDGHNV
jgi:hypothetical protein